MERFFTPPESLLTSGRSVFELVNVNGQARSDVRLVLGAAVAWSTFT